MKNLCSVKGCNRFVVSRTPMLCNMHWKRWRKTDDPNKLLKIKNVCSVDRCNRFVKSRNPMLCSMHWKRWKRHGDPNKRVRAIRPNTCIIEGCNNKHYSLNYCIMHYGRSKAGNPMIPERLIAPAGNGTIDKSTGYKRITINGKIIAEHRYIMSQFLGRQLKPAELIHHINSDKLDNRIENLQLTSRTKHPTQHL